MGPDSTGFERKIAENWNFSRDLHPEKCKIRGPHVRAAGIVPQIAISRPPNLDIKSLGQTGQKDNTVFVAFVWPIHTKPWCFFGNPIPLVGDLPKALGLPYKRYELPKHFFGAARF